MQTDENLKKKISPSIKRSTLHRIREPFEKMVQLVQRSRKLYQDLIKRVALFQLPIATIHLGGIN